MTPSSIASSPTSENPSAGVIEQGSSAPLDKARGNAQSTKKLQEATPAVKVVSDVEKVEKLSGAELKKRAKAEKAAKRVQEKQGKQQPVPIEPQAGSKVATEYESSRKSSVTPGSVTPTAKTFHKRTGSIQKGLPLRPTQPPAASSVVQSKKDNKKVALFGHLYGQPRRTTIAAAGKDVHPAVLSLGLQIRNYVICGSSARCVAMLLVFKRVQSPFVCNYWPC